MKKWVILAAILLGTHFYTSAVMADIVIDNMVFVVCGDSIVVNHTAGNISPVTVSITYGIVTSGLSGKSKCWLTQNLGASQQATSATDDTDASAGWYWQFNRMQGYGNSSVYPTWTVTPAWTITSIDESLDWQAANDPCTLLLGVGWRLPTYTEWLNADANGGWVDYDNDATGTFGSVLKLHAAGYLDNSNGALYFRGSLGYYWSRTQASSTLGWRLGVASGSSVVVGTNKAPGYSVRCLKD